MDAMELIAAHDHLMDASNLPRYEKLIDANDALVEALEPFAAFLDALELDRQGAESFYSIHNAAGSRELTRAHFRMARVALAKVAK